MISEKYKCIFIHIPKCAGTSIDEALFGKTFRRFDAFYGIWMQHATAKQIKAYYVDESICKNQWNDYFKFSVVRNPFDRILSSYNWLCKENEITLSKATFKKFVFKKGIFKKLLDPNKKYKLENRYHQIMPAVDYLLEDGKLTVDFVGRFENLKNDWEYICKKLNARIELPYLNKLGSEHLREFYNEETIKKVAEYYKRDLEVFGYTF